MTVKRLGEKQELHPLADQAIQAVNYTNRLVVALIALLCSLAIFLLGSPYFNIFPTNRNPTYLAGLTGLFLLGIVIFHFPT